MPAKRKVRIALDIAMTAAMPFLMVYSLVGEATHEWLGIAMLVLFAAHHVLNFRWFRVLTKGIYTPARIFNTAIGLLLCVDMLFLAVSGIILSNHVLAFLPITGLTALARPAHMLGSYWGLALMSVHIGLHWGGIEDGKAETARCVGEPHRMSIGVVLWGLRLYLPEICGLYAVANTLCVP